MRVTSAGTGGWHAGEPADSRASHVLREHGYPTAHRAAQVSDDHLSADLVVALGRNHLPDASGDGRSDRPGSDAALVRPALGRTCARRRGPLLRHHDDFEDVFTVIDAALPGLHEWVDEQLADRGIAS